MILTPVAPDFDKFEHIGTPTVGIAGERERSLFHNPPHFAKTCNILSHATSCIPILHFGIDFDEKIEVMEQTTRTVMFRCVLSVPRHFGYYAGIMVSHRICPGSDLICA